MFDVSMGQDEVADGPPQCVHRLGELSTLRRHHAGVDNDKPVIFYDDTGVRPPVPGRVITPYQDSIGDLG
jgi:3-mercaptopyruvate sulfurtransferase SseA